MFTVQCKCGAAIDAVETTLDRPSKCPACGGEVLCVSAEPLDAAAAAGDFDAALLVAAGPGRVGQLIRLGGIVPIDLGKQPGNQIVLPGNLVSRAHCRLVRIDFGPSRWQLEDKKSTNGLFVNEQRVTSHELKHGDVIRVGEYEFHYQAATVGEVVEPEEAPLETVAPVRRSTSIRNAKDALAGPAVHSTGPQCPSCDKHLGANAKVCVECGIRVPSGRPLIISEGADESVVYGNAETILKIVSWLLWVTPLPMPLASEAYGKHKPFAIWTISALTVLASVLFFIVSWNGKGTAETLMLWPKNVNYEAVADQFNDHAPKLHKGTPSSHDDSIEMVFTADDLREILPQFHWWQLVTHAFLHDTSGVLGFIFHLGGNMLFLIVFGSRVNAIIGNIATAIVYPLLAAASASIFLITLPHDHFSPLLGASGAINGLAGMYLVLFPAQRVYCAMWLRFRWYLMFKIFTLRGFWVLLIYFIFDVAMVAFDTQGNTAHWAHIGGFVAGMGLGVALLISRQFDCRNGDLVSLILGKYAWPLIGKPSRIARAITA